MDTWCAREEEAQGDGVYRWLRQVQAATVGRQSFVHGPVAYSGLSTKKGICVSLLLLRLVVAKARAEVVGGDFNCVRRQLLNGEPRSSLDLTFGGTNLPKPHGAALVWGRGDQL